LSNQTLILGLGNILLKDEGIGVHVIRELKKHNLPGVEIIDGGTAGMDLLSFVKNVQKLIIIDAIRLNKRPGLIYCLHPYEMEFTRPNISLHQVGVLEILSVAKKLHCLPEDTIIIGVEPKEITWGLDLTSEVKETIPCIVDLVLEKVNTLKKVTPYHAGCKARG